MIEIKKKKRRKFRKMAKNIAATSNTTVITTTDIEPPGASSNVNVTITEQPVGGIKVPATNDNTAIIQTTTDAGKKTTDETILAPGFFKPKKSKFK
jgi:cytoskeletal protein RodZ